MKEHFNAISWRIFCKSLGEKVTDNDHEADVACFINLLQENLRFFRPEDELQA